MGTDNRTTLLGANNVAKYDVPGDLADLLNFGQNRIFIYDYNTTFLISGLIISDFTFSGSSEWNWGSRSGGTIIDTFNKAIEVGSNMANMMSGAFGYTGSGMTKPQIKSPWQTVADWGGSSTFQLNLDLLFVSLTPNEDARWAVFQLLRCVYPEIVGGGSLVIPPLQYTRVPMTSFFDTSNSGKWGCVAIQIGNWFVAPPVFVVQSVNFSMSKEQTPAGAPLYANGTVSLICSHIVGANHLKQWLNVPDSVWGSNQ